MVSQPRLFRPGIRLGFTGSRRGLTDKQRIVLDELVAKICPDEASHGDCIGADAEFHEAVRELVKPCKITVWPSTYEDMRAFCKGDVVHDPMPARDRDQLIVKFSTHFIGCPPTEEEIAQSGSWMTLRMARKVKTMVHQLHLIRPSGRLTTGDWREA